MGITITDVERAGDLADTVLLLASGEAPGCAVAALAIALGHLCRQHGVSMSDAHLIADESHSASSRALPSAS